MLYDIAIVGSGFGGTILAMVLRRLGKTVLLLEKNSHPRFAMGESTSPLTNVLIEELAHRYDLPRLLPLATWGEWQSHYPDVICGLKRGFTYYEQRPGKPFVRQTDHRNELAVAASPSDRTADTHWLRSDVDYFLLQEAIALSADYHDNCALKSINRQPESFALTTTAGTFHAKFLLDASGRQGALAPFFDIPEVGFAHYPATQALYTHFTGVNLAAPPVENPPHPPYPLDDSATHHVFPGGWMWVLPFKNGVTSAGFACLPEVAAELRLSEKDAAWERFLAQFPSVREQFGAAKPVLPFFYTEKLSFRLERCVGEGFALLPSAFAFIDPLYSTGFPLTLLGIERIARIFTAGDEHNADCWETYQTQTMTEVNWVAEFIAAHYETFQDFPRFVEKTMYYFAAASFAEMARRLKRPTLAGGFLRAFDPDFRRAFHANTPITHWNVAGLADPNKHNWYDVDLADVIANAEKLGFTPDEMKKILATAPWAVP
jgi:tetracycline 7-halogenase / FADH2 O2-dependent halogenase